MQGFKKKNIIIIIVVVVEHLFVLEGGSVLQLFCHANKNRNGVRGEAVVPQAAREPPPIHGLGGNIRY